MSDVGIDIGFGVGRLADLAIGRASVRSLLATTEDMLVPVRAYLVQRCVAGGNA